MGMGSKPTLVALVSQPSILVNLYVAVLISDCLYILPVFDRPVRVHRCVTQNWYVEWEQHPRSISSLTSFTFMGDLDGYGPSLKLEPLTKVAPTEEHLSIRRQESVLAVGMHVPLLRCSRFLSPLFAGQCKCAAHLRATLLAAASRSWWFSVLFGGLWASLQQRPVLSYLHFFGHPSMSHSYAFRTSALAKLTNIWGMHAHSFLRFSRHLCDWL
jgi:hypothetical protein